MLERETSFNAEMAHKDPTSVEKHSAAVGNPAEDVNYPKSNISLEDHFIDEPRSLKVIVIGAGLAGILAGILLPLKVPRIDLTILEKNSDVVSMIGRVIVNRLMFDKRVELG